MPREMSEVVTAGSLRDARAVGEIACAKVVCHVRGWPGSFGVVEYWKTRGFGGPEVR